jgi:hypothetical protein
MEPVSPVVPGNEKFEVCYAKDQPEYLPLPALRTEHAMLTRWRLTDDERRHIAEGGDLFIAVMHFGHKLQPLMPMVATPEDAMRAMIEMNAPPGGLG